MREPEAKIVSPRGVGWQSTPRTTTDVVEPLPYKPALHDKPALPYKPALRDNPTSSVVIGEARAVQQRSEQDLLDRQRTWTVLTFRVERHDSCGNRLVPVPVEMRGYSLEGFISDGDLVEVPGTNHDGLTMRPDRVRNITTRATVKAITRRSFSILWIIAPALLLLLSLLAYAVVSSGGSGTARVRPRNATELPHPIPAPRRTQ